MAAGNVVPRAVMVIRCRPPVIVALWLTLTATVAARRLSLEYDVVPLGQTEDDVVEYVEEPVFEYQRLQDTVPYQPRVERPPQIYRLGRRQKPIKRYLGVEIPDEIAQRTAGGGGALIDKLKQQMQNSGK